MAKYVLRIRAPLNVSHYMTYRCVLDCDMCSRKAIAYKKEDELSTDKGIELMSEFRKHGTIVWGFSGGECLMRDDIQSF